MFEHLFQVYVAGEPLNFPMELAIEVIEDAAVEACGTVSHALQKDLQFVESHLSGGVPPAHDFPGHAFQGWAIVRPGR